MTEGLIQATEDSDETFEQTPTTLALFEPRALDIVLKEVRSIALMSPEDKRFLVVNQPHLTAVMERTHMWRTDIQKRSIISDQYHPTLHSKFHQAILEQKVQLDQTFQLAKDFEDKRMDVEELLLDMEELDGKTDISDKRKEIRKRKLQLSIAFKQYELKQCQTAMNYRMSEVKGWQVLEQDLLEQMRAEGMDEETIWSKNAGEVESMFFQFLTNMQGLAKSSDGAEANNLVALAKFGIEQAKQLGRFDEWVKRCDTYQLDSLRHLGEL